MLFSYLDSELGHQFCSRVFRLRAHILRSALPPTRHIISGELPNLSLHQLSHLENEGGNNTCFGGMLWRLNQLIDETHREQYPKQEMLHQCKLLFCHCCKWKNQVQFHFFKKMFQKHQFKFWRECRHPMTGKLMCIHMLYSIYVDGMWRRHSSKRTGLGRRRARREAPRRPSSAASHCITSPSTRFTPITGITPDFLRQINNLHIKQKQK